MYDLPLSNRIGDHLDDPLFRRLSGGGLALRPEEAIVVATTDDRGRPHPALLADGEVLAVSPALVVSAKSTTARNLTARAAVTLCVIGPDGVAYVKATAHALPAEPSLSGRGLVAFEARVEDVLLDASAAEEGARLTSGITFAMEDPAARARDWTERLEALRRA
jgi:hypothetical protein